MVTYQKNVLIYNPLHHYSTNMPVTKTPKSSTLLKTLKTPKHSTTRPNAKDPTVKRANAPDIKPEKKRKHSSTEQQESKQDKKQKKRKSDETPEEKALRRKARKEQKEREKKAEKESQSLNADEKKSSEKKDKKPKAEKPPVIVRTTIVDKVMAEKGAAGFFGQETKAKKMNTLQLQIANEYATNGVFHYDNKKLDELEPLTEMHLAYLEDTNPMKKMKFAKSATKYCQLENEALFSNKCRGLKVLQALSGRQTLGMASIHADRVYLNEMDMHSNRHSKIGSQQCREHLLEDYMHVYSTGTDRSQLKPSAYKECKQVDGTWPTHESDTLQSLAEQFYGADTSWAL